MMDLHGHGNHWEQKGRIIEIGYLKDLVKITVEKLSWLIVQAIYLKINGIALWITDSVKDAM